MKAYGIFSGGGVKGAALAGCLAAAEQQGVRFVGHGGTSAGSIIALLAAVGYNGTELAKFLVEELDFRSLLDDAGVRLRRARNEIRQMSVALRSGGWPAKFFAVNFRGPHLLRMLGPCLGLYPGRKLREFLRQRIIHKRPALAEHADITFEHLQQVGCLPVKIVAADLTQRRPAVFSHGRTDYGTSVLDAIRASTSYPFAFEPVCLNGRRLVDGGLSSNLPVFLFEQEYRQFRIPALAFDLQAPTGDGGRDYDLCRYGHDLLATALESSNDLLRRVLRGVHHIAVPTPPGIDTLDFALSRDDRRRLFDAGHTAATEALARLGPLRRARMAGEHLQRQLWTEFGPPQFYAPVLHALAREMEGRTRAQQVRAHIMLPTGRAEATRIVTYSFGMDGDPDVDLELPENAGCSGQAWCRRAPALADLERAAANPAPWGMTHEEHAKVPAGRRSMLSVPIHRQLLPDDEGPPPPVGTLSVDSITPLDQTGWLEHTSRGPVGHAEVVGILMNWAYVVHRLLS